MASNLGASERGCVWYSFVPRLPPLLEGLTLL
jgi:hypothetical protein